MTIDIFTCPCCGYQTLTSEFDICQICWWQHDLAQERNPDRVVGANHVTLREAQRNFLQLGASRDDFVELARSPTQDDVRDPEWQPLPPLP
jgi:cysteine-rich CPCC protein